MKVISPTLIMAHVTLGNACPNDNWQASNGASSLQFGSPACSTHMTTGSELSANMDLEHSGSGMTDGCKGVADCQPGTPSWSVKVTKNNFAGPSKFAPVHPILSYQGQFTCLNDQEKLQSPREASQSKEM